MTRNKTYINTYASITHNYPNLGYIEIQNKSAWVDT